MAAKSSQPRARASFKSASLTVRTFGWVWLMPSPAIICECAIRPSLHRCSAAAARRRGHPLTGHAECDRFYATITTITRPGTSGSHNFSMRPSFGGLAPPALDLQIGKFGVLGDISGYEGALGDNLQPVGPHGFKRTLCEFRADAAAVERFGHFGVSEGDHAGSEAIVGEGLVALDIQFEAMVQRILADVGQGVPRDLCNQNIRRACAHKCESAYDAVRLTQVCLPDLLHVQGHHMKTTAYLLGALLIVTAAIYLLVPA